MAVLTRIRWIPRSADEGAAQKDAKVPVEMRQEFTVAESKLAIRE